MKIRCSYHKFWTGKYVNNKKVGIWSNYIYDPNDDRLIIQIDYDRHSTLNLFTVNLVGRVIVGQHKLFFKWTLDIRV